MVIIIWYMYISFQANGQSSDSDVERETLLHSVDEQSKGPQGNPPHPDVKQSKGVTTETSFN